MYSQRGRTTRGSALTQGSAPTQGGAPTRGRGNPRLNSTGQNSPRPNFGTRDTCAPVDTSAGPSSINIAEPKREDGDMYKYERRWNLKQLTRSATKKDVIKELERTVARWYGWETEEPEKTELPWRDDRSESEKVIPEPDYYCCPYSRERPVRLLTQPSRPIPSGVQGVPFQRGQPPRKMYRRGRIGVNTSIPMYLRNGS